jgi:uncharacterized protein DUF4062
MTTRPVVFISSTEKDLKQHREQAAKAALASGFFPEMMEYFPATGEQSLPACLEKVAEAELVIVIVAHRYGWVPDDPANPDAKSITWLECDHAWNVTKKKVLAFVVDPDYEDWPVHLREDYRLVTDRKQPGIHEEVERNERNLEKFKGRLGRNLSGKFTDAASLRALVSEALADWSNRHSTIAPTSPGDPEAYLKYLEDDTRQIRVKGLKSKRAEPYFFGIDEVYIPLTTLASRELTGKGAPTAPAERREVLEDALSRRTVVIGEPGSGKSTFLRRVAFELCRTLRDTRPEDAKPFLTPEDRRFPILIRTADLARHLETSRPAMAPTPRVGSPTSSPNAAAISAGVSTPPSSSANSTKAAASSWSTASTRPRTPASASASPGSLKTPPAPSTTAIFLSPPARKATPTMPSSPISTRSASEISNSTRFRPSLITSPAPWH